MRVYSSIVLISKEKFSNKVHKKIEECAKKVDEKIGDIYNTAYTFYYNDQFRKKLMIEHKGTILFNSHEIKTDVVFVTNKQLSLNSIHFNFYNFEKNDEKNNNCNRFNDTEVDNHVNFIKNFYNFISHSKEPVGGFKDETWLIDLKKAIHHKRERKFIFNLSTYLYSSICIDNQTNLNWKKYALTIWKLLYLQVDGIEVKEITEKLEEMVWSSASFYKNFMQPGAIVSISTPFPKKEYSSDLKWFLPENNTDYITGLDYKNHYDFIPEYPPLRYLGVLTLEFAGLNEEILRFSYEKLLRIQDQFFLFKFWNSLIQVDKIDNLNNKVFSLEYIRPPIVRDFVTLCIDNKFQDQVQSNLSRLKGSLLNYIVLIFTIIATLLAISNDNNIQSYLCKLKDSIINLF